MAPKLTTKLPLANIVVNMYFCFQFYGGLKVIWISLQNDPSFITFKANTSAPIFLNSNKQPLAEISIFIILW